MSGRSPSLADRLSRLEPSAGWRPLAQRAYLAVHRGAERAGLHLVRASYDSPIPRRADLDAGVFAEPSPMRAVNWDADAQMRFVEDDLASALTEFRPQPDPDAPPGRFRLDNQTYDRVDAELLYGIVRWARPKRYVELGSGYSTLVAADARVANRAEGAEATIDCYDPYPSPHVLARDDLAPRVQRVSAQALPEDVVTELAAGDVLFVDTSHTVKMGGDVNRIVLDLLPLLAPGVVVHFHDIFLPWDYSRGHVDQAHFWTEQYLLQAFLMYNAAFEVLVSGQAVARAHPDRLRAVIPSFHDGVSPGAIWLRRTGAAA